MVCFKRKHNTKSLNNKFQTSNLGSDTRTPEQEALQYSVSMTFENDVMLIRPQGETAFFNLPVSLQSVRGHSAICLTVTINGMQEIHPVIHLLFKLNHIDWVWFLIHEVPRSHTTTHHSRQDSSGRVTSSSQRPLPNNTQHSQQTYVHASGGIRTHNPSRRAAADLRLRRRDHRDQHEAA